MDSIISGFFEKRKELINNTEIIANRKYLKYLEEINSCNKNISLIISYLYALKYDLERKEIPNLDIIDNVNNILSEIVEINTQTCAIAIYNSPEKNLVDMNVVNIITDNPCAMKLYVKNSKDIFSDGERDFFGVIKGDKLQIMINENTILTLPKEHVQCKNDFIQILYVKIHYYRDKFGKLSFYKCPCIDKNKLLLLKTILDREISLENINEAIEIATQLYVEDNS